MFWERSLNGKENKNEKKKWKNSTNFINGSFFFFFSSHRVCNEVINPIWVGIVPFRLFWKSCLTWKDKKDERVNQFMNLHSFILFLFSQIQQWSYQSNLSWNCSSQIILRKNTKMKLRMNQKSRKEEKIFSNKNKTNFLNFHFFLLTDMSMKSLIQFQLELFQSDYFDQTH